MEIHKPRILYMLGWFYPDSVGGTERYVHLLAKDIQEKGWDVTIAAPAIDEKEHQYTYDGITVYRYPVSLEPSLAEVRVKVVPGYFEVFQDWLRKNMPDIAHIHSRTRGCGFFHMQYIKQLGIPLVLTIHAADFMCMGGTAMLWGVAPCDGRLHDYRCVACWLKKQGVYWPLAMLMARIPVSIAKMMEEMPGKYATALAIKKLFVDKQGRDRAIFNFCDRIIVVSKWLLKVLLLNNIPERKIFISLHGLPPVPVYHKKAPGLGHAGTLRIGFIGRFVHIKGAHVLIQAVRRLSLRIHVELRIYGRVNTEEDASYFMGLQKISQRDKRIKFCGELKSDNYEEIMSNLDIVAIPSLWLETGPMVALEAFAWGIPVIGCNVGGVAELIKDGINGRLVKMGDVRAWARQIQWIYEHPETLREWAGHIPEVRSSKDVACDMRKIYEEVLAGNKSLPGVSYNK